MQRRQQPDDGDKMDKMDDSRDTKLQLEQDRVEREAANAISARRAFACRVVAIGFAVLFVVLFCFKAMSESADQRRAYSSSCMHAVGGGVTGARGSLLHFDPRCTEELKEYFDQAYYTEVRRVSDQAISYFRQQIVRQEGLAAGSPGTVIFDIDETALSNMDGFFGGSAWSRFLGIQPANRCVRPHLEYAALEPLRLRVVAATGGNSAGGGGAGGGGYLADLTDSSAAAAGLAAETITTETTLGPAGPRRPLCYAPPLRATLDLYNFLYDNNFTVVFLTGRSEDARAETEANLEEAGYGRKCAAAASSNRRGGSGLPLENPYDSILRRAGARHHRRSLRQTDEAAAGVTGPATEQAAEAATVAAEVGAGADATPTAEDSVGASDAEAAAEEAVDSGGGSASSSSGGGSGGLSLTSPFGGLFSPPSEPPQRCYQELVMRTIGDDRLASVFKSEARARLVEGGHVLVGNIGDQFSDLVGQAAATANFKLPNPVYTLL